MEIIKKKETDSAFQKLLKENETLRQKLVDAEEMFNSQHGFIVEEKVINDTIEPQIKNFQIAQNFYQQLVEIVNDGLAIVTVDHEVIFCNSRLAEILDVSGEKIVAKTIDKYIYSKDLAIYQSILSKGLKKSCSGEIRIDTTKRKKIPILLNCYPINKNFAGAYLVFTDLTEIKKIQDELVKVTDRFEGLVNQRTEELEASNKALNAEIRERRKIEVNLIESKERYQSLVDDSPDGVIVHRDGQFVYANSVAIRMYGATSLEQLQTKSVLDLIHPDNRAMIKMRMEQGIGGVDIPLMETKMLDLHGKVTYVESVGSRISFMGKPSVQIIIRDITERKKKEFELLKLNQTLKALDKSSQAMVRAKDENSYLNEICQIIINDCHYSMVWIGYAQDDNDKTVKPMAYAGFEKGYLETLNISWADSERGQGPTGIAIRTGTVKMCKNMHTDPKFAPWREQALKRGYASSIALPISLNEKTFGALTIYSRDPDPFTSDEAELLCEIASDLAYGITAIRWRLAQEEAEVLLKKNATELKELNATKDKFFGIIAHDLKNPFASMLGTSEILSGDISKFEYETIQKFATIMYNATKSGYSLLENLLEWSRSQTGTLAFNPKKLNIRDIINQTLTNMSPMATNKTIQLYSEVLFDLEATADSNMLHTILRNLVTNAIKFTYPGGKVSIKAKRSEDMVIITIMDTGVGIPKDVIQKLFRIDSKFSNIGTAEERGTGLGLMLCKEFVVKHGGRIWVESKVGEGSSFHFTIPQK